MLTAHLPSGYVLARLLPEARIPLILPAALLGAVLPDFDMIWFHFIDHKAIHHHRYWVHIPLFWGVVASVSLPLIRYFARRYFVTALVFFAAITMHLLLDSLSGGILWGMPFSDHLYSLVTVPATQDHWVLSFMLHWSFLPELVIWAIAIFLWLRPRKGRS